MNENLRVELYNTKMEQTSLLLLVKDSLDKIIILTTNNDYENLSLMSNKLAIIYHKLDVVSKRLKELEEEYKSELFKDLE